jgi:hypothetical protein
LEGHVDGQPIVLLAEDRCITLSAGKLKTLMLLRRSWHPTMGPLKTVFESSGLRLLVRVGLFGDLVVFPNPIFLIRLLLPKW